MGTGRLVQIYADTSVFGGVFDDEFARGSEAFFSAVRRERFRLMTSALVEDELGEAPLRVRLYFNDMLPWMERAELTQGALGLRQAYIRAGIVSRRSATDALHVAVATVNACGVLVSWNCRHIVNFRLIPMYNAVNRLNGWEEIAIHTPLEVASDEDEGV